MSQALEVSGQCTRTFSGAVVGGSISAGEIVCSTADFNGSITINNGGKLYMSHSLTSGAINVQNGGELVVCGSTVDVYGSITIGDGGAVTLTSGTLLNMAGGTITAAGSAAGNIPFRYQGDPTCYAEVHVQTTTHLGAPNTAPFMNSTDGCCAQLTNSNRIYFDGIAWVYANANIGSGNVGSAPSFCTPVGSCSPCTAGTANAGGALAAICQGGTSAAMGGSIGGGATAGTWSGGAGTWTNASNPATATYTAAAGESGSITLTLTATGGCSDVTATKTITVNANPTITGTTPASRCGTGTVALGATASAGTINWYAASSGGASLGTGTSFTTPSISSTTTYYVDATSGSCTTPSRTAVTATVNPNPTANAGGALAAICQGGTSAAMGGSVGGGATGGTWSGGAGTWTNAGNPATATYTADAAESGSITLTLTTSGGSCGTTTATKNITVNPNPTANAGGALAAICQGGTSAAMGGSVGGGATGGTWSGGAGTWTNAGNPATATYTADASESGSITLTLTTSGGSCGTTTATKNITVNQNPTANAGGALTAICAGGTSAAMGGSVGGGATGGTWSGGAGSWTNASNPATATYTAHSSEAGSVVTLTLTTSGGSCGTTTATKNISVTANNTAGAGSSTPSLCNNTALTNITHATTGATGISNSGVSGANGLPTGVSASWAGDVITISGTPSASGTFNYSIPLTGGCGTVNATGTITVYGSVTAGTIGSDQTITVGATPSTLTEPVAASGGNGAYTYQWQSSTNDGATWSNAAGTSTNATYSPGALSVETWYRRVDTDGCSSSTTTNIVKITVLMSVCSGSSPSAISSSSAASGGGGGGATYQWQSSTTSAAAGFSDIGGETGPTLSPGAITQNTWYRRAVTISGCTAYSNVLKATMSGGNPGGVGGPVVWLKADAGTGSIGTQWEDQSGNNNHYTTVSGPTLVSGGDSSSNFNPYIKILDGGFDAPAGAALGSNYTLFAVAKKLTSDLNGTLIDGHTAGYSFAFSGNDTAKSVQVVTSSTQPASGIQVDINTGASSGSGVDAHVYELIIYNRVLPTDTIEIVESYLETKYGIKGSDNYLTSTGSTTYNAASYSNDIIGIGKECYFHQKQSATTDDSVKITVSATGSIGDLAANNGANAQSITNDISYLMLGHNGGGMKGTSATSADIPPAGTMGSDGSTPITILSRIDREWKITNTNFSDNYAIKFEVIPTGLTANDIVFMVDDDGDFTDCGTKAGTGLYFNGDGSGISISIGSITVGGLGAGIIGAGATKFVALASKGATSVLPVEMLAFSAINAGDYNRISWTTQSELNNSHFIVEKSLDGIVWETIQVVQGAGNSNEQLDYAVNDYDLCADRCYYRINQVDYSGKNKLSEVRIVEQSSIGQTELIIYPVPVTGSATVEFNALNTEMYVLEVYSVSGASIYQANVVCVEGENVFDINTSGYASGMYYLMMRNMAGEVVNKVTFTK